MGIQYSTTRKMYQNMQRQYCKYLCVVSHLRNVLNIINACARSQSHMHCALCSASLSSTAIAHACAVGH